MAIRDELLLRDYHEVNAHLRVNMSQFVNWFSLFLTLSFIAMALFEAGAAFRLELRSSALLYGTEGVFLLLHLLAFGGILTFRHYIVASHCKVEQIISALGEHGGSPIPVRFCKWMTNLMAAGYLVSYLAWFSLLLTKLVRG